MSKLVYWEIPSQDLEGDASFFASLFGWRTEPSGPDYVMIEIEDGPSAGMHRSKEPPADGIQVYIGVDDIPEALARAEALGATVLHPKSDIGQDWGYWADFRAPGGARIGLYARE